MFLSSDLFCWNAKTDRGMESGSAVRSTIRQPSRSLFGIKRNINGFLSNKKSQYVALGKILTFLE